MGSRLEHNFMPVLPKKPTSKVNERVPVPVSKGGRQISQGLDAIRLSDERRRSTMAVPEGAGSRAPEDSMIIVFIRLVT